MPLYKYGMAKKLLGMSEKALIYAQPASQKIPLPGLPDSRDK
jgi:hypothetical protein